MGLSKIRRPQGVRAEIYTAGCYLLRQLCACCLNNHNSSSFLLCSMIPPSSEGFLLHIDSKIPEQEQLQDLGPRGPGVTQESQAERSNPPHPAPKAYAHNHTALSPRLSSNKLNTLPVSNCPAPRSFFLLASVELSPLLVCRNGSCQSHSQPPCC